MSGVAPGAPTIARRPGPPAQGDQPLQQGTSGPDADVPGVRRICVAAALVYRLLSTLSSAALWVGGSAATRVAVLVVVAAFAAYHVVVLKVLVRGDFARLTRRRVLVLDVAVSAAAAVVFAGLTGEIGTDRFVGWTVVVATVAVWTLARGWAAGLTLTVLSVPLVFAIGRLVHGYPETSGWSYVLTGALQCVLALAGVALLQPTVWARMSDWARAVGNAERAVERARAQRVVHDTAVQTLDAIRLLAETATPRDQAATLRRVREVAAREVVTLRAMLDSSPPPQPLSGPSRHDELADALRDVARDAGRLGLEVVVSAADGPTRRCSPELVLALRGAVGEALVNTAKHSGASRATVQVGYPGTSGREVEVVVLDHGRGFDPRSTVEGFGLRESIRARMAEVGGGSSVTSWPQGCVLVRLWAPA